MKSAFLTDTYGDFTIVEALKRIRQHGYDGAEIFAGPGSKHIDLKTITDKEAVELWYVSNDLELQLCAVAVHHPDLTRIEAEGWEFVRRGIEIAHLVNAPLVTLYSGGKDYEYSSDSGDTHRRDLFWTLGQTADYARTLRLELAFGAYPGSFIADTVKAEEILKRVNHPSLKFMLSTLQVVAMNENIGEVIERLGNKLVHVHVADTYTSEHKHLIPGEDDADFQLMINKLKEQGYQGYMSFQPYSRQTDPDDAAKRCIELFRRWEKQGKR